MNTNSTVREQDRVLVEDALKHLYNCAEHGQPLCAEGLAANEEISLAEAKRILSALEQAGLASECRLTETGRAYALQVIRAHRLYETYLALETGYDERRWHPQAHDKEHRLSAEEVNELAVRLGHPRFDPHGDPIPTADGHMPEVAGKPLSDWPPGQAARIIHIEDEPEAVYAQLAALGFVPGLIVRVLSATPQRLMVEAEGQQHVLAPMVAANLTVTDAPAGAVTGKVSPLSAQPTGQCCRVAQLSPRCRGAERRRLMDLGFVPGTVVEVELRGPMGDPTGYRVRETLVALRREQAEWVLVETA
ncbi:MAG: DNA-binding protein [Verrucomicrobia bacterium]|nr:DNA-binding protein [Verrucomicrobiota bacterium]